LPVVEDLSLYVWYVTLAHFLTRRCRIEDVAMIFIVVACGVAFLTVADAHLGLFGGRFAGTKRATGTFENPNMFGDYLVGAFFITWAAAAAGRRIFYAGLPLLGLGVLSTHSNGCLVSLIGGCGVAVAAYPRFWKPKQLGTVLVLGGTLLGIVGVFHDQLQQLAVERFSGSRTEVGGAALKGASERLPIWENILKLVAEKPGGIGPGNLADLEAATARAALRGGRMIWAAPAAAFLISLAATPVVRRLALLCGATDVPDARRVHSRPTARAGGVGVALAAAAGLVLAGPTGHLGPLV